MIDKKKISRTEVLKLINKISKLEAIEFMGLLRLFSIQPYDSKDEPRDFYELLDEFIEKYYSSNRDYRRKIDKILKAVNSKEKK